MELLTITHLGGLGGLSVMSPVPVLLIASVCLPLLLKYVVLKKDRECTQVLCSLCIEFLIMTSLVMFLHTFKSVTLEVILGSFELKPAA